MGMKKSSALMMMSLAMMASGEFGKFGIDKYEENNTRPRKIEPIVQKGMKYYCFRNDGTFKLYERDGAMLKTEMVFSCWALNDKNAIKKFHKFANN